MHNVWLIARREYVERIRTRGFLITTVMIPLIMGGLLFGSAFVNSKSEPVAHIAVVSSDTQLALDLQSELQQQQAARRPTQLRQSAPPHRRRHGHRAQRRKARRPSSTRSLSPATSTVTSGSHPRPRPARRGRHVPPSSLPQDRPNRIPCEAPWPPPSALSSCAASLPTAASPPPTPTPSSSPSTSSPPRRPIARTASPPKSASPSSSSSCTWSSCSTA